MARGSYGAWTIADVPFTTIRDIAIAVLEDEGYKVSRRSVSDKQVRVQGIRGSKLLAHLGQALPFGGLLGIGSRVKATVLCRRSLTAGDPDLSLTVRCAPVEEWDSLEESLHNSQGHTERIGDNAAARRCFKRLVRELHRRAVI